MSFGGSVAAMITSIKNNARTKRKSYFERDHSVSKQQTKLDKLLQKKASPKQLKAIKDKIIQENNKRNLRIILSTLIILITIYFFLQWLWMKYF
ncbi:hypothetical protein [Flavicella sediminum]|uniref:hypothetical protein n=1 Tax=Flavicella sediminum TaxID=2585141 RepID=UPI00111E590E|nr:hypothetical protein [Flavicella sediminum]